MPEFTNSSVGSFAGTSELEATMLWPLERKYSRKAERIWFDCMARILKDGREGPLAALLFEARR